MGPDLGMSRSRGAVSNREAGPSGRTGQSFHLKCLFDLGGNLCIAEKRTDGLHVATRASHMTTAERKEKAVAPLAESEYEAATIRRALDGDHEAGREALRLCRSGLDNGTLSRQLAAYLAERLTEIDRALDEADRLRKVKTSRGSVRSARDAAIAEALCIKRPAQKTQDPLPDWQVPYAALGALLFRAGFRPEQVKAAMSHARVEVEGKPIDRADAGRMLVNYSAMLALSDDELLRHARTLREQLHEPAFVWLLGSYCIVPTRGK